MAERFDSASKAIIDTNPLAWLRFVGIDADGAEILNSDMPTKLTLDRLIKPFKDGVTNELLHYELMTYFNAADLVRFGTYNFLAAQKNGMPVRTTLVLLKKMSGYDTLTGVFAYGSQLFQYDVVKLWEISPQRVLMDPGLLPLLPLTSATLDELPSYVEQAKQTAAETTPDIAKDIWFAMRTFSGLVYSPDQTTRFMEGLLKMVDLRESTTYQEILREGEAKGKIEGEAKGKIEGEAKGKIEGKGEVVNLLLSRRFSTLGPEITERLDRLSSCQFDDLALALLDFSSLADLENWLNERHYGNGS